MERCGMLLITGTGRSGTHYMSYLMCAMGFDLPHERVGRDGTASWKHIVTGTFINRKGDRRTEIRSEGFARILHIVRHPLKVISSMQTFGPATWRYMAEHAAIDADAPLPIRGMHAWVEWNRLVEIQAHWRFQIESLPHQFDEFCRQAGVPGRSIPIIPDAAADSRVKRYRPLAWDQLRAADALQAERVRDMANAYGYGDIASWKLADQRSLAARLRFWS
jgi:hypothetical protein